MSTQHTPSGPVVVVGFVGLAIPFIERFQPPGSVVYVEEPDVARKRQAAEKLADVPYARGLIAWEYHQQGQADAFFHAHRDLDPAAIVPAVEYATPFAARLAERYGLPGASLGAAQILRDKALLRQVTSAAGIANPASRRVEGPQDVREFMAEHPGPVVLKPANRQASIGVQVLYGGPAEAEAAWAHCVVQDEGIFVPDRPMELAMLAEEFVRGPEFSVEMLVGGGEPLFTNVTRKELYPGSYPVELAHVVPADIPAELTALLGERTAAVVEATGFRDGVVHCEWIVSGGEPHLVECAGRMPGDAIVDIIEAAYPVEFFRAYFAVMKGERPDDLPEKAEGGAAVRFLAPPPGTVVAVEGVAEAAKAEGVFHLDCGVPPGTRATGVRNSWDRVGIVMTRAGSPAEAYRLGEQAAALVRIETE
jgi:biotin carboxylase